MYTRPYNDNVGIIIPESYNGTAFRDEAKAEEMPADKEDAPAFSTPKAQGETWDKDSSVHTERNKSEPVGSFLQNLPISNLFGGIFKNGRFSLQKIGTEEILIIATAAFLFFSKDGDKECALMLLLLLFLA